MTTALVFHSTTYFDSDVTPYSIERGHAAFYASTPKRGLIEANHFYRLGSDRTIPNAIGSFKIFGKGVRVKKNTTYTFMMNLHMFKGVASAVTETFRFDGVTITDLRMQGHRLAPLAGQSFGPGDLGIFGTVSSLGFSSTTAGWAALASNAAGFKYTRMWGSFKVGSTDGILYPSIVFASAPGAVHTVRRGSWIEITPVMEATRRKPIGLTI